MTAWSRSAVVLALGVTGCVLPEYDVGSDASPGATNGGATGGSGGEGVGGGGGVAGEGNAGAAGEGTGGSGGGAACESNAQCISDHLNLPYVCRDGACLALTNQDCPALLGAGDDLENIKGRDPIFFGAYDNINLLSPTTSFIALNYRLAIDEFNDSFGLPVNGEKRRPFVAILCQGVNPDVDASMRHLVENVKVPAVIASLYTQDLLDALEAYANPNKTFLINPLSADNSLIQADRGHRLWHLLGTGTDLARAHAPLLQKAETFVRSKLGVAVDDDSFELRVAMLVADTPFLTDMAEETFRTIEFNGTNASENRNQGNFLRIDTDAANEGAVSTDNMQDAIDALLNFAPHVVLALSAHEFAQHILDEVEGAWDVNVDGPKPFYVVSPLAVTPHLLAAVSDPALDQSDPIYERMLGVNYAAAADSTLYDAYFTRLEGEFGAHARAGTENFYDAAYYLMYAIAGAGDLSSLDGDAVAVGMQRLIDGPERHDVGPNELDTVVNLLRFGDDHIRLYGTMGPPDFDPETRAREALPSIYCITPEYDFVFDVMTYDEQSGELQGDQPCVPGF